MPTFGAIHRRLNRTRGPATNYACVDCDGRAAEWSYDGADPNELHEVMRGSRLAYSLDPNRYVPRCVPCHRQHDLCGVPDQLDRPGVVVRMVTIQ